MKTSGIGEIKMKPYFDIINIPDDIQYEYEIYLENLGLRKYLILYPAELRGEKILEDNKQNMLKIIGEYIHESEMYSKCMDKAKEFHFDIQKQSMIDEAHDHQRRADELAEKMDEGISPYAWYYKDGFIGYIDNKRICCDYVIYLDNN